MDPMATSAATNNGENLSLETVGGAPVVSASAGATVLDLEPGIFDAFWLSSDSSTDTQHQLHEESTAFELSLQKQC